MDQQNDWNPALYLQFQKERARPCADLAARIEHAGPQTILDVGCGPGNSAQTLLDRWTSAQITGIDSSEAMIASARGQHPAHNWVVGDVGNWIPPTSYDLLFSNAALQWVPNHADLLTSLLKMTNPGGVLAVQIPQYHEMPVSRLVDDAYLSLLPGETSLIDSIFTWEPAAFYDNQLRPRVSRFDLWETTYFHPMPNHQAIVEMLRSTGLRPYLDKVSPQGLEKVFEGKILEGLRELYPAQTDGVVLFPFRRLFFIAYR